MENEPMVSMTVADMVRAQRAAYGVGVDEMYVDDAVPGSLATAEAHRRAKERAAKIFPLPKVTQRRVVEASSGYRYKVENGVLLTDAGFGGSHWVRSYRTLGGLMDERSDSALLIGLFANPTEEVDA